MTILRSRLRWDDEQGAVVVIVGLLFVALFALGTFVVDWGAVYHERRQLQNGADAGALAVAADCALGNCGDYTATAADLVDPNAEDSASAIDAVTIDMAAQTATVDTSTSDPDGGSIVPFRFGPLLGNSGGTVHASATAQWSAPLNAPAAPLIASKCEWDREVGSPENLPSGNLTLWFHTGTESEPCNGPAGQDTPGGFGWVDGSDCEADITIDEDGVWVESKTGNTPTGTGCSPSDFAIGSTILLPIFDQASGQGTNAQFHLIGFAAFEIAGIGLHNAGGWTDGQTCAVSPSEPGGGSDSASNQCITGRFVDYFVADAIAGGPNIPDFGVKTVTLIK